AGFGERLDRGEPDALRRGGDEYDLAVEIGHCFLLFLRPWRRCDKPARRHSPEGQKASAIAYSAPSSLRNRAGRGARPRRMVVAPSTPVMTMAPRLTTSSVSGSMAKATSSSSCVSSQAMAVPARLATAAA